MDEHETSGQIAPQTVGRYRGLIAKFIVPGLGGLRLTEATTGRIDAWLRTVAKKTPTNARHLRILLAGAFSLAVRHDALRANTRAQDAERADSVDAVPSQEDVIFPSHAGTLRSPNNCRRQLREALQGTGYEWVTPHRFRRIASPDSSCLPPGEHLQHGERLKM